MNTRAEFFPECYYHVYNQTNGKEKLFRSTENRRFFLSRFAVFIKPFCHIHAYALMSNHFHFSVAVKSKQEIMDHLLQLDKVDQTILMQKYVESEESHVADGDTFHLLICDQFKRFFTSYTRSYNNSYGRSGSLFRSKFKRSLFDPKLKFRYLQYYIHHNGRKHGVVNDFKDYAYHSYQEIVDGSSALIDLSKVLEWYKDIEDFTAFHESVQYEDVFRDIDIEGLLG